MKTPISPHQLILCSAFRHCVDKLIAGDHIKKGQYNVGVIKNAADFDKIGNVDPSWVTEDLEALKELGYTLINIDLTTVDEYALKQILAMLDAVFVTGGNTFRLLECMIRSRFRSIIKDYIKQGLRYISTSAGSCVTAHNITYVQYADDQRVSSNTDYGGLGFLPIAIKPHFSGNTLSERYLSIYHYIYTTIGHDPLITLSDDQAILGNIDGTLQILS